MLVENRDFFSYLLAFDAPVFEDMYNRLHTIPACDGQTDEQTFFHGIVRAMLAR